MLQYESKNMLLLTGAISIYIFYTYSRDFLDGISLGESIIAAYSPLVLIGMAYFIIFKRPVELAFDSSKLIFVIVYLVFPFILFFKISNRWEFGDVLNMTPLLAFFILLWISDTMAYVSGSLFGKNKLSKISQNKTWEGLIGGMLSVVIVGFLFESLYPNLRGHWGLISIIVAILGPIGDLAESKLKRIFRIKDSSQLLGGHGGFLDRLDSFLLASVGVYFYFLLSNMY